MKYNIQLIALAFVFLALGCKRSTTMIDQSVKNESGSRLVDVRVTTVDGWWQFGILSTSALKEHGDFPLPIRNGRLVVTWRNEDNGVTNTANADVPVELQSSGDGASNRPRIELTISSNSVLRLVRIP